MQKRLTAREKNLVAVAALAVTVYLLTALIIYPLVGRWQQTGAALAETRAGYTRALKIVRLAEKRGEQNRADTEAAGGVSLINFLRDLESAAGTQVIIRRFQPLASSPSRPVGMARNRGRTTAEEIRSLQVQIDCVGQLSGLMAFLERIETAHELTRIRQFHLAPEGSGGATLHAQLTVVRLAAL
jgi:hypothetical protein